MITFKVIAAISILFALNFAAWASEQGKIDSGQRAAQETQPPAQAPARCVSQQSE